MHQLFAQLCCLVLANAQASIIDGLGEAAAEAAETTFEGRQVQVSSDVPQADSPIQQQREGGISTAGRTVRTPAAANPLAPSQAMAKPSPANDSATAKAVKSRQADSSEEASQHDVDLARARYVNATILERKEAADADAAKVKLEQETMLAAIAANKSAASQAAASAAKAQFEAAEVIEERKSAAAVAARAKYANATLFEEKESGAAKAAEASYEQEKANLAATAAIQAAASVLALIKEKALLKRKEQIEEEMSAAADAARASYANATLFEQKEAGAANASKVAYEQEEAILVAMAANKSAASQAALVEQKAQLLRQERVEEEKSTTADEAKAKAIASVQAALRKTAAAQHSAEASRAKYANATRIEQEEAAKAHAAKTTYERAAAESAFANKELHYAQWMQNHAIQMEAKAANIQAQAQHELADAYWSQPHNLLPWLLVALMSSCVMWEGVWRLFNGTSNMKSVLAAKLLEGSPCNHLQLGSHPIGPQIPSCDDQFELQADQGLKANLKNKGNPYQHDTEDVKTCSFTPPKTSRGKAFVPPLVLTPVIETTAPSSSKELSSV